MKSWKERKQIIVDLMKNEFYVPMKEKELAIMLQVAPEERSAAQPIRLSCSSS